MNKQNDITTVTGTRSLIDLSDIANTTVELNDWVLKRTFDDIILVELIDENENSEVERDGLFLPGSVMKHLWRKGKVILTGQGVELCKVNDIVMFPNDKGVLVTNVEVENYGKIRKGMFLNERRIFGILEPKVNNE